MLPAWDSQYRCASSFLRFGSSEVGFAGSADIGVVGSDCEACLARESKKADERGWLELRALVGGVWEAGVRAALS